jgi:hypothetical protein
MRDWQFSELAEAYNRQKAEVDPVTTVLIASSFLASNTVFWRYDHSTFG